MFAKCVEGGKHPPLMPLLHNLLQEFKRISGRCSGFSKIGQIILVQKRLRRVVEGLFFSPKPDPKGQ